MASDLDPFPPVPRAVVAKVARCLKDLPETSINETNGNALELAVRKRRIGVLLSARAPDGRVDTMLVVRADPDELRVLVGIGHPYFRPRTGPDRVGVVLGPWTDWTEIRELLTEGYLIVAPKSLAALVDIPETG